jgi:hypothetical protein
MVQASALRGRHSNESRELRASTTKERLRRIMTRNYYYLAAWSVDGEISYKNAAQRYALFATQLPSGRFDERVYRFYSELTRRYPEIEMTTDEKMESSPWACGLELADDHVIMALLEGWCAAAFPVILNLAESHGLVCYDPQTAKVYVPAPRCLKLAV